MDMRKDKNIERIKKLHQNGMTILVHHAPICDRSDFIDENLSKTISLIYTDKWYPFGPHPTIQKSDPK